MRRLGLPALEFPAISGWESVNDTLQFPLPLLAYGPTVPDRLETVICHATFTTGQHRLKVLTP
jgi:hypothetical protein